MPAIWSSDCRLHGLGAATAGYLVLVQRLRATWSCAATAGYLVLCSVYGLHGPVQRLRATWSCGTRSRWRERLSAALAAVSDYIHESADGCVELLCHMVC